MKEEVPWQRFAVEAVVIVVSILLAFAIDAWWEERSERQLEKELLASVLDSIRATEEGIVATYGRMDMDAENLRWFYNASEAELSSVPRESLVGIGAALQRANTFDALAMLRTADISLIRDSEVRSMLGSWLDLATNLAQYNEQLESMAAAAMLAMGRHAVIQQSRINGGESLTPEIDLSQLREDEDLMAIVSSMSATTGIQRTYFLSGLQELNERLEQQLVTLIDQP